MRFHPKRPFVLLRTALFLLTAISLAGCGGMGAGTETQPPKALREIVITPAAVTVEIGGTLALVATGVQSDGSRENITATVTWSSSDAAIVSVAADGVVSGVKAGSARISASAGAVTGSNDVKVNPAHLVSIRVQPESSSVPVGEGAQLTANAVYSDGTTQDVTGTATWNSSGSGIASVSASGMVSAVSVGTATISAASGSVQGNAMVQVAPPITTSIEIIPSAIGIPIGTTRQIQALAHLSDGSSRDITNSAAWSSSPQEVIGVSETGMAVAMSTGTALVTASDGAVSGTGTFTVTPLMTVNYFDLETSQLAATDTTMRLTNTGLTGGDLCAMIYVFDNDQQLSACCGCLVTPDGLRTLSVGKDLTSNPLTGTRSRNGVITVVPSQPRADLSCDPAVLAPSGAVHSWVTHIQANAQKTFSVTEAKSQETDLSDAERTSLESQCGFLIRLGSGQGVCTCGTGD